MDYKSMLFIPGNQPGMVQNADILGAEALILDLEDAVALEEKDAARVLLEEMLAAFPFTRDVFIRVNPMDTPFFSQDVALCAALPVTGILLPKATEESVRVLSGRLEELKAEHLGIFPLIESALGVEKVFDILRAAPGIRGVLLGAEDLTLDLGAVRTKGSEEIAYARSRVVMAAKALGIQAVDTPFTDVEDQEGLVKDTLAGKALGMTGKAVISPRHVEVVNRLYAPTEEEILHARRLMYAMKAAKEKGLGAFSVDGKMVDAPIIKRAERLLKAADAWKEEFDALV